MRKRYLLLFIILMLFPVLVFAKNDIYSKNADIYINKDGSANVTLTNKVAYGTSAPSTLADGKLYCVIES